jgi:hypothetical protein
MVALADRVIEVVSDLGPGASPRYRYGSGCVVSGRTVLTAAHAVADADTVWVRGRDKRRRTARVDPAFIGDVEHVDLALIELEEDTGFPPLPAAALHRAGAVPEIIDRCHAVGYPNFKERTTKGGQVRDTVGVGGHIALLSNLVSELLTLHVTASPRPLPQSGPLAAATEWSGMSGAPVWAGEYLIGVVTEHAPREGPSSLTVTPLTHIERLGNAELWWPRVGVENTAELVGMPAPDEDRRRPAYTATLREIHARTPLLLNREHELAEVAAFAISDQGYRWLVGGAPARPRWQRRWCWARCRRRSGWWRTSCHGGRPTPTAITSLPQSFRSWRTCSTRTRQSPDCTRSGHSGKGRRYGLPGMIATFSWSSMRLTRTCSRPALRAWPLSCPRSSAGPRTFW